MPKTTKGGRPRRDELPSTLRKSPPKAQRTWAKTHDAAAAEYGEGERAHRTAYAALKHSYEKVGDHWERKAGGARGPSDRQAAEGGAGRPAHPTAGGVDANASKTHLYDLARRLDIPGRSRMSKADLVRALQRESHRETARARSR